MKFGRRKLLSQMTFLLVGVTLSSCRSAVAIRAVRASDDVCLLVWHIYRHDPTAFTEGLEYVDGVLYESTGLYGQSSIRRTNLRTGSVTLLYRLPAQYFGEGITHWRGRIIQLTYRSRTAFVYDRESLTPVGTISYRGEGWGLTNDGTRLIMSDGSAALRLLDPETFREIGRLHVRDEEGAVTHLNELEYVHGEILANVWPTGRIVRIDATTGEVRGWLDLSLITRDPMLSGRGVLNGVAFDSKRDRMFVTGKRWSEIFEVSIEPIDACGGQR